MNFKKNFKRFFSLTRSAEGFTLVELIVVIAILAILAGVAVPAYSGYIKRANEAMDMQHKSMLNNVFHVVCIEMGADPADVTIVRIDYDETTGVYSGILEVNGVTNNFSLFHYRRGGSSEGENTSGNAEFVRRFNELVGGDITFKSKPKAEDIIDGIQNGVQEKVPVEFNGTTIYVDPTLAAALKNNTFSELGAEKLLGKVDTVADIASLLIQDAMTNEKANTISQLITEDYLANLATSLGYDLTKEEDVEAFEQFATSGVLANSLVLAAAQNSQNMDTSFLGQAGATKTLRNELDSDDPEVATEAMAKLALTYAMYTSYCQETGKEDKAASLIENQNTLTGMTSVLDDIESEDFAEYMNGQGQKDLDAYMASMQIINDTTKDNPAAAKDILTNGFNSDELSSVLNGLMGN